MTIQKNTDIYNYIQEFYLDEFSSLSDFDEMLDKYHNITDFAPNGNFYDYHFNLDDKCHFIMRIATGFFIEQSFKAMKLDITDCNVASDISSGNIGTAQRLAKVWTGFDTKDSTELGSGRWMKKPRLATFPNSSDGSIPITKRIDLVSNCSHHFITFSSLTRSDSYAIVSYIPDEFVLGISKLQRLADWVSRRFWLQEDVTKTLYEEIAQAANTSSVLVHFVNIVHGCESFRGAQSNDGAFTSSYYGGAFDDLELRNSVINGTK
jgi:GTP cyclohydrolase I